MSEHTFSAPFAGSEDDWIAWANRLPMFRDLGVTTSSLAPEGGTFQVDQVPLSPNPNGAVNGGLIAAVSDLVAGAVAMRAAPAHHAVATASLHITYERPARAPLVVRAHATKRGRTLVFVVVSIHDERGALTSSAKATMMLVVPSSAPASLA